jgi:archaemetzincin
MASKTISIVLIQPVNSEITDDLLSHVEMLFDHKCTLISLPLDIGFAFAEERRQYNSTAILGRIKSNLQNEARALLAIINDDLYASGLNFVFGEAEVGGKVGIISLARLRPAIWDEPDSLEIIKQRTRKEATHELGHIMGLRHCRNSRCVMYFSNTLGDTDKKADKFCPDCAHILAEIVLK